MNPFDKVLHQNEIDISRAVDAAGQRLVEALRAELSKHKLHNHKLMIAWTFDYAYLQVNGEAWNRHPYPGAVLKLLDDIDDILGKCDDAVIKTITDTVL